MLFRQIEDPSLAQYAYLIGCQRTRQALLIDPERDIDRYLRLARDNDLTITAVAETHIHADFVSGTREFLETQEGVTAWLSDMGDADWKYEWAKGRQDVRLLHDGDRFQIGKIEITALHTPGHTPEHLSYLIVDHGGGADQPMGLLTGDFVFVGDVGRPDLLESAAGVQGAMEPSARLLFASLQRFRDLDDFVQVFPGHGAGSACGKALGAVPVTTVGYEKRFNNALQIAEQGEDAFVQYILEGQPEPPPYFARMKRLNKEGPAVLGRLPRPSRIAIGQLGALLDRPDHVLLDLSPDRQTFLTHHHAGALFAPLGPKFTAVAGSYLQPEQRLVLAVPSVRDVDEAVRDLVRIGFDHIVGYLLLDEILNDTTTAPHVVSTRSLPASELQNLLASHPGAAVLDVRSAAEFAEGHVPGATQLAYTRLAAEADRLPPGSPLLVHCASGLRSAFAASWLEHAGREVIHLDGPVPHFPPTPPRNTPTPTATTTP